MAQNPPSAAAVEGQVDPSFDPMSQADPLAEKMGGKKKKKKKGSAKKLSKSEKAAEKMMKAAELFTSQTDLYASFIERMDKWMRENYGRAIDLFRKFDVNGDGTLTYDEFKAGMADLQCPCNMLELHVLALKIDKDKDGTIDYLEFSEGLRYIRDDEILQGDLEQSGLPALVISREDMDYCPCCGLGLWSPTTERYVKYIKLFLRLVTFDKLLRYPGHLVKVVHSHVTIFGLIEMIKSEVDIASTKLKIFRDKSWSQESILSLDTSLEECGFKGGSFRDPPEVLLYYDFVSEFNECPLLMADYFFLRNNPKKEVKVRKSK